MCSSRFFGSLLQLRHWTLLGSWVGKGQGMVLPGLTQWIISVYFTSSCSLQTLDVFLSGRLPELLSVSSAQTEKCFSHRLLQVPVLLDACDRRNHRMVEVGSDLWVYLVQPPARAGTPRAGCPGPSPDGFWTSPRRETPQPLWAASY